MKELIPYFTPGLFITLYTWPSFDLVLASSELMLPEKKKKTAGTWATVTRLPGELDWVGTSRFLRARSLSHTNLLPLASLARRRRGLQTLLQSAAALPRVPLLGDPPAVDLSWWNFSDKLLLRAGEASSPPPHIPAILPPPPGPRPAARAGDRTSPGRALCVCKAPLGSRGGSSGDPAAAAAGAAEYAPVSDATA